MCQRDVLLPHLRRGFTPGGAGLESRILWSPWDSVVQSAMRFARFPVDPPVIEAGLSGLTKPVRFFTYQPSNEFGFLDTTTT